MSEQSDETDKSFDPTPQKLLEARKKGEVAKSVDLMTAAGYAGLTLALFAFGSSALLEFGSQMSVLLDQPVRIAQDVFEGGPVAPMSGIFWHAGLSVSPIFLFPALAVLIAVLAQRAFVVAPSKLQPKLSRISLIQNAKQKFGRSGFFEFFKSFLKLVLYSVALTIFLVIRLPDMVAVIHSSPGTVTLLLIELSLYFLGIVVLISAALGGVDAVFQYQEHMRKNRMSRKEIMDETKNSEGDPYMKQERRARAQGIAAQRMMQDVPMADVVVVNPTHYAVALKWDRTSGGAPTCVAKGVDAMALRIREVAQENAVPIHSDPPTARALHATTEIGSEIEPEHYHAVAAAIRFADKMRARARHGAHV